MHLLFIILITTSSLDSALLSEANREGVREWAEFVYEHSTPPDKISFSTENLILHLKTIKTNLDSPPWKDSIPEDLVYHYVIPPRVSQEPLENFTWIYRDSLYAVVRGSKSIKEAILKINEWCFTRIEYRPTEPWDQSALATLRRGFGRCEEMTILFMKALRTVGIPVRYVYVPWWPFTESNHAWVEVWTGKSWDALGSAEPTDFNFAWFSDPAKRAGIVLSIAFGDVKNPNEPVLKSYGTYTVLNVTSNYTNPYVLDVTVKEGGVKVKDAVISFSVWNYSAFVPLWSDTLRNGEGCFQFGRTDILVYAKKEGKKAFSIVKPVGDTVRMTLTLTDGSFPDTSFWFRTAPVVKDTFLPSYTPNYDSLLAVRSEVFRNLDFPFEEEVEDSTLRSIFKASRGNWRMLWSFYQTVGDSLRESFEEFLKSLDLKDLVMMDTIGLRDELLFLSVTKTSSMVPAELVDSFVLRQRIYNEGFCLYRAKLYREFRHLFKRIDEKSVKDLFKWTLRHIERSNQRAFFKPFQNPLQTFELRNGSDIEIYTFLVGILRTFGIPAKLKADYDGIEYWLGQWKQYSFKCYEPTNVRETPVYIKFFREDGNPVPYIDYYYNFSIQRFLSFPERLDLEPISTDSLKLVYLEEGEYYIMYGFRNASGDVFVKSRKFIVKRDPLCVNFDVTIPPSVLEPGDLVARSFDVNKLEDLQIIDPADSGNVFLCYIDLNSEASKSSINAALDALSGFRCKIVVLTDNVSTAQEYFQGSGIIPEFFEATDSLVKSLDLSGIPSFILIMNRKVVFYVEGPALNLGALLKYFTQR